MEIEPDDIFITSDNFRGFLPFIPGHIFNAFMLADAEPKVLQPCDSTVWVIGEPVVIAWQGAALSDIVVPRTVDSLRFMYDIPLWNCRIELYKEKEFVCDITHASSTPTLSRIDWTYPDDLHFYSIRIPVIELREREDPSSRSDTSIYRRQHGTGYRIKLISFSIRSTEEIEIWSDSFEIVNPVLEAERINGLSDVWDEFINSVERVFAPRAFGTIAGRVYDPEDGRALPGYRITLVKEELVQSPDSSGRTIMRIRDTGLFVVSDSSGEYSFTLPEGLYTFNLRGEILVYGNRNIRIIADSTFEYDFRVQYSELARYRWEHIQNEATEGYQSIVLRLNTNQSSEFKGFSVYCNEGFVHPVRSSDNEFTIRIPGSTEAITCFLPGSSERTIQIDPSSLEGGLPVEVSFDSDDLQYDSLFIGDILGGNTVPESEWHAASCDLDRSVVDIMESGHPELLNAGYLKARVFFDEADGNDDWRIVLIYHEKIVVLDQNRERIEFNLGLQTRNCILSENGRYIVAFDAYGFRYRGGDAVIIDSFTGESILFDPSPRREYMDPYYTGESFHTVSWNYHPLGHVANDGRYARYDEFWFSDQQAVLNLFNKEMELVEEVSSDSIEFIGAYGSEMSVDGYRILLFGKYQDDYFMVIVENGRISSITPIYENRSIFNPIARDEALSVIMTGSGFSGVSVYSGESGELLHHWHGEPFASSDLGISPDGRYASYSLYGEAYEDSLTYIVRSLPDGDIVSTFRFNDEVYTEDSENWFIRRIYNISNNCRSLFFIVRDRSFGRFVLFDRDGRVLWLSPARRFDHYDTDFGYLSDDGSHVAYSDGNFINILKLNECEERN